MAFNEIVTSVLIALGAGIMFLCVLGTRQILGLLQRDKYSQGWRTLFFLMIFFLVGYLAALAIVLTGIESFLHPLTGVIFFFGALFVYLVVQIGRLTINDLKQEIIERQQLNTEWEQRVAERTAQLEALNQELETFAYSVSHDIRAPLRAIYGYANFLAEDLAETLEGEQKRYLTGLTQAVDEAETLIADLLALSRLGRQNIRLEPVKVGPFLQNLIASLNLSKDVKIELTCTSWPSLDTEPTLLRQIFQNLILNAIKFNHTSPKYIQLGWHRDEQENHELFVRDNGIGIDPLYHEKIFGLFQRLHTSKEFEGTGIGLALVKKAVRKLNGSIRVDSVLGEGSTFFVTLPK